MSHSEVLARVRARYMGFVRLVGRCGLYVRVEREGSREGSTAEAPVWRGLTFMFWSRFLSGFVHTPAYPSFSGLPITCFGRRVGWSR